MHEFVRPVAAALSVVCLAAAIAIAFAGDALGQANQAPPQQLTVKPVKQMALTDKQIEGVLAAQKDMEEITAKLPDNPTLDKITEQLDGVASKNGFASYDEYTNVVGNISLVLLGFDPATKHYVGAAAGIKAQIAQAKANKAISPSDRKEALAALTAALTATAP